MEIPLRKSKPSYPFSPKNPNLLLEGKELAKCYRVSFNQLMVLLLERAIGEWKVPERLDRPRPATTQPLSQKEDW